jgi:hypothetical protein
MDTDYKERMKIELADLNSKIESLNNFIYGSLTFMGLPSEDQDLLKAQCNAIYTYAYILNMRIKRLKD